MIMIEESITKPTLGNEKDKTVILVAGCDGENDNIHSDKESGFYGCPQRIRKGKKGTPQKITKISSDMEKEIEFGLNDAL